MERTNKDNDILKWKKTGGGSFHATINGRLKIIKPGEVFEAKLWEIPESVRDIVKPVGVKAQAAVEAAADPESVVPDVPAVKNEYFLKHRGGSWYNVLDINEKVMNEKALQKVDAVALIESLTA